MINYDKLNGAIVTRTTLDRMFKDKNLCSIYLSGKTICLDRYKIQHKNGNTYYVYVRGGAIAN